MQGGRTRFGPPYMMPSPQHLWNLYNNESVIIPFGKGTLRILLGEAFLLLKVKKFRISLAESRNVTTFAATPIAHEGLEGQILSKKGR